jgi:hypothetical protein
MAAFHRFAKAVILRLDFKKLSDQIKWVSANALTRDFATRLQQRFAEDTESMPMSVWIEKNTSLRKKPFSFKGFEFQRAIVDDMHPDLSCIKCSQIGLTEVQLRKNFGFLKRNVGTVSIFTLPKEDMFKRISTTRAGPIVNGDPVFNQFSPTRPARSMALYQIDQSFGYFTGMTEGDATSINADALFHDEVDLSDQEMMGLFQSRLQGSEFRITQGFSTPTFVGYGIDADYNVSDKRHYMCRCPRCRHHNEPTFAPQFIHVPGLPSDLNRLDEIDDRIIQKLDLENSVIICERCGGPLPIGDPDTREWVAERPGARKHGYRVTPFATPRLTISYVVDQLLLQKRKGELRYWYNTVLGEPYNDSNARLSEAEIRAIMKGLGEVEIGADVPVAIGIDVGQTCHVVLVALHQEPVVFKWMQVPAEKLPKTVSELREMYNIVVGGMDRHPYEPLANQVRDESEAAVFPIEYRGADPIRIVTDEFDQFSHVQANRTKAIDAVAAMIRKARCAFAGYGHFDRLIIEHFMDMVRMEEPDEPAVWNKLTGQDHFFHALVFAIAAVKAAEVQSYNELDEQRLMAEVVMISMAHRRDERFGLRKMSAQAMSLGTAQG